MRVGVFEESDKWNNMYGGLNEPMGCKEIYINLTTVDLAVFFAGPCDHFIFHRNDSGGYHRDWSWFAIEMIASFLFVRRASFMNHVPLHYLKTYPTAML